jgi:hypothetical protein
MDSITDMSSVWGVPVEVSNETLDISALEAAVGTYAGDNDISTDLAATKAATVDEPGVARKLAALTEKTDDTYEILYHKFLKNPLVNDPAADRAEAEIVAGEGTVLIQAVEIGIAGNAFTVEVIEDGEDTELSCTCSVDGAIVINLATDENGDAITTATELVAALRNTANFNTLFNAYIGCNASDIVVAMTETAFTGGNDGNPLESTGEEIDNAVEAAATFTAIAPELGKPFLLSLHLPS